MVVHPAPGNYTGTLVNALMYHCGDQLSSINGVIRPGIVHRIDKDTSGLLMVAKNDKAHASLSEQLANHSITRRYKAIVYSNIKEDEGTVDAPIGRDPRNRLRNAVTYTGSKEAVTHYKVLERFGNFTLIEAKLETGRTHQIRVHMSYIKHPLLGDQLYGPASNKQGARRQMLHAGVLGFIHPTTGEYMEFNSPLPEDFEKVLYKIRKG
jgi:23S rRNA pseudouridine1911/1915/1917 synthase